MDVDLILFRLASFIPEQANLCCCKSSCHVGAASVWRPPLMLAPECYRVGHLGIRLLVFALSLDF